MEPKNNDVDGGNITVDLYPFLREYKGGRVERFLHSPFVAASEDAAGNRGVATRDVVIDETTGVSARLFLPSSAAAAAAMTGGETLPVILYIHGGSFCTESAFGRTYNNYARSLAARAGALVVSVEYRLAPEHPLPTAYDDAWAALQWVTSLSDPWLSAYAEPGRTFLAGDSAGGNIAYNTAVRASRGTSLLDVDIEGLIIVHPYFWGADRLSCSETVWDGVAMFTPEKIDRLWPFVTAGRLGEDDPRVNPLDDDIASLTCQRVLIAVAGKDSLRHRGSRLAARMRGCAWADDESAVTLVESEAEDHGFHLSNPLRAGSKILMDSIVQFIKQPTALPLPAAFLPDLNQLNACQGRRMDDYRCQPSILGMPTRPYMDLFGYGMAMKDTTRACCLQIGLGKASKTGTSTRYGQVRPTKTPKVSLSATAQARSVLHNSI